MPDTAATVCGVIPTIPLRRITGAALFPNILTDIARRITIMAMAGITMIGIGATTGITGESLTTTGLPKCITDTVTAIARLHGKAPRMPIVMTGGEAKVAVAGGKADSDRITVKTAGDNSP